MSAPLMNASISAWAFFVRALIARIRADRAAIVGVIFIGGRFFFCGITFFFAFFTC